MFVLRQDFDRQVAMLANARKDAQSAYDRLDQALYENGKLIDLLDKERERSEMLTICLTETLREALGFAGSPGASETAASGTQALASTPEILAIPDVVQEAIDQTFPGDQAIREINTRYAHEQKERWESEALELADEIRNGVQV